MKRVWAIALLLTACSYQRYAYRLEVPGAENGKLAVASGFQAEIREESGRRMNPQKVKWEVSGPLLAEGDGKFRVLGPGKATLRAKFALGGETKTLEGVLQLAGGRVALATPAPSPTPTLEETPEPEEAVAPTPVAVRTLAPMATPTPGDDAESMILAAYSCADRGEYSSALKCLEPIRDPSWLPKVRALKGEWSKPLMDQLIDSAAKTLLDGDYASTLKFLNQMKSLSKTPKQQAQELRIRQRLKEML